MPANFVAGPLKGVLVIEPKVASDERGLLYESYKQSEYLSAGLDAVFVQDVHSVSRRGVLRGLHFQRPPHGQGKLVRVVVGSIWDVAVDLRKDSPTFGRWFGVELSAENRKQVYFPPGFAHGFLTTSDTAEVVYKCTAEYHPASEGGIRWDDPDLAIAWPALDGERILSPKDLLLPQWAGLAL